MTDDSISTLYRRACPSCARQYARDSRACPFCGYVEDVSGESEADQDRLYGEYLIARCQQSQEKIERLRQRMLRQPGDRGQVRLLVVAETEDRVFRQELESYQATHHRHETKPPVSAPTPSLAPTQAPTRAPAPTPPEVPHREQAKATAPVSATNLSEERLREERRQHKMEPPRRAIADKECPVCTATVPREVKRCACGYIFGGEMMPAAVCPHCTAPIQIGVARCSCGHPIPLGPPASGIPGLSKR
ncbi:MAG TPA: hypothetical protein VMV40_04605 [Acidiferrobacter sp.]|nr:hypothetical protein [Acidiferrobacter sp.]